MDTPVAAKSISDKFLVLHFDPAQPQWHVLLVKCEQPLDDYTYSAFVPVPPPKLETFQFICRWELRIYRQTNGQAN